MNIIANIIRKIRGTVEKEDEREEYSGGFLPFHVRQKTLSLIENSRSLLDIGCGEGLLLAHASMLYNNKKLYGIDPWKSILDKAVNRGNACFFLGDGDNLPFQDNSFDEVTMLNLFMNIRDIDKINMILKEGIRVCKRGGKIFFDYRNSKNLLIWYSYKTIHKHDPDIKVPVVSHGRRQVKNLLTSAGDTLSVKYHSIPAWWIINSPAYLVEITKI